MELDTIREVTARVLNVDPNEISENTTFLGDLGADSLDIYQIVMGIEEELEIQLPPDEIENITTVGEAIELIKKSESVSK